MVLAQSETDRARGAEMGADEVLPNPPSFADVHSAVVHLLSRALLAPAR
jgi:DNA-binding response OmpR family regulator